MESQVLHFVAGPPLELHGLGEGALIGDGARAAHPHRRRRVVLLRAVHAELGRIDRGHPTREQGHVLVLGRDPVRGAGNVGDADFVENAVNKVGGGGRAGQAKGIRSVGRGGGNGSRKRQRLRRVVEIKLEAGGVCGLAAVKHHDPMSPGAIGQNVACALAPIAIEAQPHIVGSGGDHRFDRHGPRSNSLTRGGRFVPGHRDAGGPGFSGAASPHCRPTCRGVRPILGLSGAEAAYAVAC